VKFFSKPHLNVSESGKNNFFYDVIKAENYDKKCLTLSKKNQKSPFEHFRFGKSNPPFIKDLIDALNILFVFKKVLNWKRGLRAGSHREMRPLISL
jgi:hypothetical protein